MSSNPTKRKRACRSVNKPDKDIQYVCGLLNEIQDLLGKYDGEIVDTLQLDITNFINKYETYQSEEESEGEELKDEHSWSDECSEHSSDREFLAPSDEDEEDGDAEYQPSESSQSSHEEDEEDESSQ